MGRIWPSFHQLQFSELPKVTDRDYRSAQDLLKGCVRTFSEDGVWREYSRSSLPSSLKYLTVPALN